MNVVLFHPLQANLKFICKLDFGLIYIRDTAKTIQNEARSL